jgi:hypothetical protein
LHVSEKKLLINSENLWRVPYLFKGTYSGDFDPKNAYEIRLWYWMRLSSFSRHTMRDGHWRTSTNHRGGNLKEVAIGIITIRNLIPSQ